MKMLWPKVPPTSLSICAISAFAPTTGTPSTWPSPHAHPELHRALQFGLALSPAATADQRSRRQQPGQRLLGLAADLAQLVAGLRVSALGDQLGGRHPS